jgi:HAD superfamily hydrolase (TIGR01509 family)
MIRALSLDFGGTLAAERTSRAALYGAAAAGVGHAREESTVARAMAAAHARLPRVVDGHHRYTFPWFDRFLDEVFGVELGLPRDAIEALRPRVFATFADPATFALRPGATEAIAAARAAGLRVAVTSNWSSALPGLLAGLGLADGLDAILVSADEGLEKPEAAFFERAAERLGVAPDEVLHVGDRADNDVRGARAAGMAAAGVAPSGTMPLDPRDADVPVLTSLLDLPALLPPRSD